MKGSVRRALQGEAGATAIEYSLVAGMIAFVIIVAVSLAGADLRDLLQGLAGTL